MKLVVRKLKEDRPYLHMVPETDSDRLYLSDLKGRVLMLGIDHFDADSTGFSAWNSPNDWSFNLILSPDPQPVPTGPRTP